MHPVSTEDIAAESPPRPLRHALRELAISIAVIVAIALVIGLLSATPRGLP